MAAAPASRRQTFPSGCYGKMPAAGDFVARRVPGAFCDAWGRWLQPALEAARRGGDWPGAFLSMPAWRFMLAPGLLTPAAWAGVMVPSVDSVGRYFPLAVASALPSARVDVVATLFAAQAWFDDMEQVALSALSPHADLGALDAAIAARPFREEWLRPASAGRTVVPDSVSCWRLAARVDDRAAWLAEASDVFGRTLLMCDELPPAEAFRAMMDGRWREHGWTRREGEPG